MITIKADNSILLQDSKITFLLKGSGIGSSSLSIINPAGFAINDIIMVGELGQEDTELFQITAIDALNNLSIINLANETTITKFPHTEGSLVVKVPFNVVKYYYTVAPVGIDYETPEFDINTALEVSTVKIDPTSPYTGYIDSDANRQSGIFWFKFGNTITNSYSAESNPVFAQGFEPQTALSVIESFDSLLTDNDLAFIRQSDKYTWLNEAIILATNQLNQANRNYMLSTDIDLPVTKGTKEILLPDDFSELVYIRYKDGQSLTYSDKGGSFNNDVTRPDYFSVSSNQFYLRGRYIGFNVAPEEDITITYQYRRKNKRVLSPSDYINMPDDMFESLKDFMLYRAHLKLRDKGTAATYLQAFGDSLKLFIVSSQNQNQEPASWGISKSSLI